MPYKDGEVRKRKAREYSRKHYAANPKRQVEATMRSRRKNPAAYKRAMEKFKASHPDYFKKKNTEYYEQNKEDRKRKRRSRYAVKPQAERDYQRGYYKAHREEILTKQKSNSRRKEYFRKYYRQLKQRVIAAYGSKCECCGETHFEFLTIDHVGGGGRNDRANSGAGFYARLEKRGFPKNSYRLLCMNCNFAHGIYGSCPHKTTEPVLP